MIEINTLQKKDKLDIKIEANKKRKKDLIKQVRDSY